MLALQWALEATKHFTLQNPKLVVNTNHQPLISLMENSYIENLYGKNKRLGRLKERTLRWNISQIVYTPGKNNTMANAFSRRPAVAAITLASIKAAQKISDDNLVKETMNNETMQGLIKHKSWLPGEKTTDAA